MLRLKRTGRKEVQLKVSDYLFSDLGRPHTVRERERIQDGAALPIKLGFVPPVRVLGQKRSEVGFKASLLKIIKCNSQPTAQSVSKKDVTDDVQHHVLKMTFLRIAV